MIFIERSVQDRPELINSPLGGNSGCYTQNGTQSNVRQIMMVDKLGPLSKQIREKRRVR